MNKRIKSYIRTRLCMRCGREIYSYKKNDLCKHCAYEILRG